MQQNQSEIVILKPTSVFQSFLASQLPEADLPSLQLLRTNNTAYALRKQPSDEATLVELKKQFPTMFRYELSRWLGPDARNAITESYLDFLCCFKMEFHSHLIILESSLADAHQVLAIRPRLPILNWLKSVTPAGGELRDILDRVEVNQLGENSSLLVKNFAGFAEIKSFLRQYYQPIFNTAMSRMSNQSEQWPQIKSYNSFIEYFTLEIHTQLINLAR